MKRIRMLLADDHTMVCDAFRKLLEPEYEVISAVGDGHALLKAAGEVKPDLVLLDIGMPLLNGVDAGRELKKMLPCVKIIFLTMNADPYVAREALRIGASGYLLKNSPSDELLQAIHSVVRGGSYVTLQVSQALEKLFIRDPRPMKHPRKLSVRETEILQLFAEGRSGKEIADILGITNRTVWYHKYRIQEDLGCSSTAELVQYAIKHAMITPP